MLEKESGWLSKWKWLLPQLSYRGRVLVVNNLAASTLWHRTIVMEPLDKLISNIQRAAVNFISNGQHWIRAPVLYLPVQEGSQGLVDVSNRICAFRIQAAQWLLYNKDVLYEKTASAIMSWVGGFGLDKHLFLMKLDEDLMWTHFLLQNHAANMEISCKNRTRCAQFRTVGPWGATVFQHVHSELDCCLL